MNKLVSVLISAGLILISPGLSLADVVNGDFSSGLNTWITNPSDQVVATDGGFGGVNISNGQAVLRTAGLNSGYPDIKLFQTTDLPVGSFQVEFNYRIGRDGGDEFGGTELDQNYPEDSRDNLLVYLEQDAGNPRNIGRIYSTVTYIDGPLTPLSISVDNLPADYIWIFFCLKDRDDGFFTKVILDDIHITQNNPGPAPVPEPGTMLLLGSGLAGLAGVRRKRKEKSQ